MPVLFLLGFDAKVVIATSLTAVLAQLITGSLRFHHHKKIDFPVVKKTIPFFVLGAFIGAFTLMKIENDLIKKIVSVAIIFFAIFSLFNRKALNQPAEKSSLPKQIIGSIALFLNGIYQIAIMAGAGTVSTFVLIYLYGLDLKKAIGTKQLIHIPPIAIAAIILGYQGLIDWVLIVPLVAGRIVGSLIGAQIMIKTKSNILSVIFSIIVMLLAFRILFFQ